MVQDCMVWHMTGHLARIRCLDHTRSPHNLVHWWYHLGNQQSHHSNSNPSQCQHPSCTRPRHTRRPRSMMEHLRYSRWCHNRWWWHSSFPWHARWHSFPWHARWHSFHWHAPTGSDMVCSLDVHTASHMLRRHLSQSSLSHIAKWNGSIGMYNT